MKKKKHQKDYLESLAEMVHQSREGNAKPLASELDAMYGILRAIMEESKEDDPTLCVVIDIVSSLVAVVQLQLMMKEVV